MSKPDISKFLRRADRLVWSRFLSSPEGVKGLAYLRISFSTDKAQNEADLIRNGVGFEVWQECVAELEKIGEISERPERADNDDQLEQ